MQPGAGTESPRSNLLTFLKAVAFGVAAGVGGWGGAAYRNVGEVAMVRLVVVLATFYATINHEDSPFFRGRNSAD